MLALPCWFSLLCFHLRIKFFFVSHAAVSLTLCLMLSVSLSVNHALSSGHHTACVEQFHFTETYFQTTLPPPSNGYSLDIPLPQPPNCSVSETYNSSTLSSTTASSHFSSVLSSCISSCLPVPGPLLSPRISTLS